MKKLFSYLLISSMVVLSSCTNYDDQFDDLNTQINTLKSQIEGFSSLSSGLTALQGTVASLQTAIANIPATDISGLESTQATLTAALTSLAADVKALQDTLATAATAAEVAALQTALTAAQTDLTELLAANNVYTPASNPMLINSAATLAFAETLGNKIGIINGDVTVTQNATMDATKLAAVLAKIKTVTGDIIYTATETSITPTAGFTSLTGVTDLTVDANGDISFPSLTSAGQVLLKNNDKVTSVSFPSLTSLTHLGGVTFGDDTVSFTKATSFNMGALKRYPATPLSITIGSGLVNLDALQITNDTTTPATEEITNLTINGATEISLDALTKGEIDANKVALVDFPLWQGNADSSFPKAAKVVLPSITGAVDIDLDTFAEKATYFHMIGAEYNPPTNAAADSSYPTFTAGVNNSQIETLILDGSIKTVTVNGASDLTSYTHTGKSHDVDFINNDSMTSVTFGYTTTLNTGEEGVAITYGSLEVSGNSDLTSVTGSFDDISKLDINDNTELATLSFPNLNSLGTAIDGTALIEGETMVNITGNALQASKIQLPSPEDTLPAVAGKITTDSGLDGISVWIGLAAALDTNEVVEIDEVESIMTHLGAAHSGDFTLDADTQSTQNWTGSGDLGVYLVRSVAGVETRAKVDGVKQKSTFLLSGSAASEAGTAEFDLHPVSSSESAAKTVFNNAFTSTITGYIASDVSTWAEALGDDLNTKLDANGYDYTVEVEDDFGRYGTYTIDLVDGSGAISTATGSANPTGAITFTYGNATLSNTLAASSVQDMTNAIVYAINQGAISTSWLAATVAGSGNANKITVKPILADGALNTTYTEAFDDFEFTGYSEAASATGWVSASNSIVQRANIETKQWRLTVINDSYTVDAPLLDYALGASSFASVSGINIDDLVEGSNLKAVSQTNIQVDFTNKVLPVSQLVGDATVIDLRTWF